MIDTLKILGYYSLVLVVLGTLGNLIIMFVSIKTNTHAMFALFGYLAFSDMLSLYFWNLSHFIYSSFDIDIQNFNVYMCKFGTWIQYSSLQSSAWILVSFVFDFYSLFDQAKN